MILFAASLGAFTLAAAGGTLYVNGAGTGAEKGTEAAPWRTIGAALKVAKEGDAVRIAAGVYRENLAIAVPKLSLVGAGPDKTIIDAAKDCGIRIKADGASVASLCVRNAAKEAAIHMQKCRGAKISNCAVLDSPTAAFRCDETADVEILNNSISACNSGFHLVASTRCTIKGTAMKGCGGVMDIEDTPDCIDAQKPENFQHTIDGSNTSDGKAIYYRFGAKNETIENLDLAYLGLAWSEKMTLRNLTFNKAPAAMLVQTHNSTIEKNSFTGCPGAGMYVLNSKSNLIENNVFKDNAWGLRFECAEEQVVKNNVFTNNKARGIAPWHSRACHLIGNKVSGSEIGIMFKDCLLSSAVDNDVRDSSLFGIELATFWGAVKNGNKILSNRVTNAKYAIYVWGGKHLTLKKDTTISGNTMRNCETGVYIAWATNSMVSGNTFIDVKNPLGYDATAKNTTTTNARIGVRLKVVVNDARGLPVPDAAVTLDGGKALEGGKATGEGGTATTGKDGRAELNMILEIKKTLQEVVSCGPYIVKASKGKAASASAPVDPKGSREVTLKLVER